VRQYGKKTLILDEHRRMGHVSLYLGEDEANYHFYELVRNVARLDESLLQGFVIHHSACLDILPSPDCFDDSANVSLDDIQRAIRFLGQNYEFLVIDCPHGVHNLSLATIDCCDELYLIATPDVAALRDLSRCVDRFLQSNVPPDKIKVVINRYTSQGALSLEQVEKAIRQPIAITIPNSSSDLIRAMNTGSPIPPDRKSEFAIQMKKWAASLVRDVPQDSEEPKRRFAFWN
jgi:pilus assembly protein CpaE